MKTFSVTVYIGYDTVWVPYQKGHVHWLTIELGNWRTLDSLTLRYPEIEAEDENEAKRAARKLAHLDHPGRKVTSIHVRSSIMYVPWRGRRTP